MMKIVNECKGAMHYKKMNNENDCSACDKAVSKVFILKYRYRFTSKLKIAS